MSLRQANTVATVLAGIYVDELDEKVVGAARNGLELTGVCPLCVTARGGEAVDLHAPLQTMARAGPGPNTIVALIARDGTVRSVHADGRIEIGQLSRDRVAPALAGRSTLEPFALDGSPRAIAAAPLGPDLAVAVGLDLGRNLAGQALRRDQDQLWVFGTCLLLVLAAGGMSALVEWTARRDRRLTGDRVALTRANADLKDAHDRARTHGLELQTIFTFMSDGVSHFDRHLRLVQWNQRFPDLAGVPIEALRAGMDVAELLLIQARLGEFGRFETEEEIAAEVARRMQVLRTTTPSHMIERPRPDGRTLELRRSSLPGGGFVTIYTDITVRKQVEAAREAARAQAEKTSAEKARFVAIVSHEIRTPLNVILNAIGLLDRNALPAAQRNLVETGMQAGDALLALLNDILDLSRIESGQLPISPSPFALRPLIAGVADMYRHVARSRGIGLQVNIEAGVPERINTDAGRLRQMLMNLVSNAAKFAAPGPVCIDARVIQTPEPALRLAVLDSGPIIDEGDRNRLFQPFSQLERIAVDSPAGSGLGLAICSLLARRMDGAIGCEARSIDGRPDGNEFWITLPLDQLRVKEVVASSPPCLPGPSQPMRVLIVEDVVASRLLLQAMLRLDGHEVEVASSGVEAIDAVATKAFDIVLMDMSMPGMGGVQATQRIRALPGAASGVPIVGVTANVSDKDRKACLVAGMTDVIAKPIERRILAAAMNAHARRAGARASPAIPRVLDRARTQELPGAALLLQSCLDDLDALFPQLAEAAHRGDVGRLNAIAHAMSGAAGNHGFEVLENRLRLLMATTMVDPGIAASVPLVLHALVEARQAATTPGLVDAD